MAHRLALERGERSHNAHLEANSKQVSQKIEGDFAWGVANEFSLFFTDYKSNDQNHLKAIQANCQEARGPRSQSQKQQRKAKHYRVESSIHRQYSKNHSQITIIQCHQ